MRGCLNDIFLGFLAFIVFVIIYAIFGIDRYGILEMLGLK